MLNIIFTFAIMIDIYCLQEPLSFQFSDSVHFLVHFK